MKCIMFMEKVAGRSTYKEQQLIVIIAAVLILPGASLHPKYGLFAWVLIFSHLNGACMNPRKINKNNNPHENLPVCYRTKQNQKS